MVKLTIDLIARGTSGYTKKKRDESMQQYLKRLTHLYLEDRCIDEVGEDLSMCRNLTVLYLYDNQLLKIPILHHNQHLTMLYLQNNDIHKIENLSPLTRLIKLYLGGNCITVIEGLDKLEHLQELHIENQRMPPGEKLLFDPRTLRAISSSLQVLNIAGNNLDSIKDIECLRNLYQLHANDNLLTDMKELAHVIGGMFRLWRLDLMGNPLCHKAKYRDRVIVMAKNLDVLDGKEISETSRRFLHSWHDAREVQKKRREEHLRKGSGEFRDSALLRELPPVKDYPRPPPKIPGYMMPGLPRKQFDEILARTNSNLAEDTTQQTHSASVKTRSGILRSNNFHSLDLQRMLPLSRSLTRLPQHLSGGGGRGSHLL
ncbi:protein phosphatase 1 regulatory subunit 42-like isoform X8 [Crassostrea virginica]